MTLAATLVGSGQAATIAATTNNTKGRLLLIYAAESGGNPPTSITGITGLGGTWAKRTTIPKILTSLYSGQMQELWWIDVPSNWSSGNVVVTLAQANDNQTFYLVHVNSSLGLPIDFDGNASLPFAQLAQANTQPLTKAISTTSAAPLILMCNGTAHNQESSNFQPAGFTWTQLGAIGASGGVNFEFSNVQVALPGAAMTGQSTGPGTYNTTYSGVIVDALTEIVPPASGGPLQIGPGHRRPVVGSGIAL
jgi:hypothetical protein